MIKRVKLETIYKMAKEDNEEIKNRKLFPDGWDEKVYDYYNKLSKDSYDVEMFMDFLSGNDTRTYGHRPVFNTGMERQAGRNVPASAFFYNCRDGPFSLSVG